MKYLLFACFILIIPSLYSYASDKALAIDYWYAWTQEHLATLGYPKKDPNPPIPAIEIVSQDALKGIAQKYNKRYIY